jgi:hypothetical protein
MAAHTKGYIDNQPKRDTSTLQTIPYDNFFIHDMTLLKGKKVKGKKCDTAALPQAWNKPRGCR